MSESLLTSQTPVNGDQSDGGSPGVSVATTESYAIDGALSGVRFWATATGTGVYTVEAWTPTVADGAGGAGSGSRLAFKVNGGAITAGTWNVVAFDTPLAVTAGQLYRIVVNNSEGRYVYTQDFFTSTGLTTGNITAYQTGTTIGPGVMRQGTSLVNTAPNGYPTNSFSGSCYFVGGVFDASAVVVSRPPTVVSFAVQRATSW